MATLIPAAAFTSSASPLTDGEVTTTATALGMELPAVWAVMSVETRGCGFLADRRPVILFERHIFSERTAGRFDVIAPDLSNSTAGGYGPSGDAQYGRLSRAIALARVPALESASWGLGQVMGFNAPVVGFADVESMVTAMCVSEDQQFKAMARFIESKGLTTFIQQKDWAAFAARYNGASYRKNSYDTKLASNYARYAAGPLPSLRIRSAQLYLTYLGYKPGTVDGWFGSNTQRAVLAFQRDQGDDNPIGTLDDKTLERLQTASNASAQTNPSQFR